MTFFPLKLHDMLNIKLHDMLNITLAF